MEESNSQDRPVESGGTDASFAQRWRLDASSHDSDVPPDAGERTAAGDEHRRVESVPGWSGQRAAARAGGLEPEESDSGDGLSGESGVGEEPGGDFVDANGPSWAAGSVSADSGAAQEGFSAAGEGADEGLTPRSSDLEVATGGTDSDDDVHFGVAAKALGVSRKTVERMVKRGQLERGPSGAQATVSKRSLVSILEQRRVDLGGVDLAEVTRGTSIEHAEEALQNFRAHEAVEPAELEDLLFPLLENLIDELVAARTRSAVLENQMDGIADRVEHERSRDELLLALATGNWRQRRRARRDALRHFVRRGRLSRLRF